MVEIFQPFGSEAWPSSQRDGVCQSQEVVVQPSGRSAGGEGAVIVAQRVDLRGKARSGGLFGRGLKGTVWSVAAIIPSLVQSRSERSRCKDH